MSDASAYSVDSIESEKNKARIKNLERVRKKLRERDSRLSVMVRDNDRSLLAGDIKPYEARHASASCDDSKEAVRVLSYAAFTLQKQVDKKADEAESLRQSVYELEETLKEKDEEKSTLTTDMKIFRRSLEAYSDQIDRQASELETKTKELETLVQENDHYMKQAQEWKGRLNASHKDYEWMRKESMAKSEQIEYFEYELLAKNDEIDKLHQEIDKNLRRIAELEVDLELVDTRTSRATEKNEKSLVTSGDKSIVRPRPAASSKKEFNPADDGYKQPIPPKRIPLFRLRELKCQSKAEDPEAFARLFTQSFSGEESLNDGSFPCPTDRSTDTTAVVSSTDGSSSPRSRRSLGRRNHKSIISDAEQYIDVIDELRSDLRSIEEKYKQDKYDSNKLIEKLRQENNEYLIKLVCLDCKTRNNGEHGSSLLLDDLNDSVDTSSVFDGSAASAETPFESKVNMPKKKSLLATGSKLPNKTEYLQRKVESMEGERLVAEQTIGDLKAKLAELERFATNRVKSDKRTIDDLAFQNEAQAMKISQLEQSSRFSALSDSDEEPEYTTRLEEKVEKQSVEIEKLHLENELKDRAIEALRSQLVDQRVRQGFV